MAEKNIRITRWIDGEDRIVTVNDKLLSESEIVDLLVEYMDENKQLNKRIKELESFIKKVANNKGEIILFNGYGYNIREVMKK